MTTTPQPGAHQNTPTRLAAQARGFPVPRPSARSAPFWEGCQEGRLVLPVCGRCGARALRAFALCPQCQAAALSWEESSGRGSLYSWTIVQRPPHPAFAVPYAPAIISLDEGWWVLSAIIGCEIEELREGLRLEVEFHPASDTLVLPYFRPST
jgi:uncharacterized OB-fold protein